MGTPGRQLSPGLAISLSVLAALPACGAGTGPPADTSTSREAPPTAVLSATLTEPSRRTKRWVDLDSALADVADRTCNGGFAQYTGQPLAGTARR